MEPLKGGLPAWVPRRFAKRPPHELHVNCLTDLAEPPRVADPHVKAKGPIRYQFVRR